MLDSGAAIPVWCSDESQLMAAFPSAVNKPGLKSIISGFGSGFQIANVYKIPRIEFCNNNGNSMFFEDFYLPVIEGKSFGADLIFPCTMLKNSVIVLCNPGQDSFEKGVFIQSKTMNFKTNYTYKRLREYAIEKI